MSVTMKTGATSSTPGSRSICAASDCGITALEKEKKMEEFGG